MCICVCTEHFRFCVAIGRFIRTLNPDGSSQVLLPEESLHKGDLTPAMDIFSAGCALAELFNEVHDAPFDLSEMLAYCSSEDNDFKHLDNLEDPDIRVNFFLLLFFSLHYLQKIWLCFSINSGFNVIFCYEYTNHYQSEHIGISYVRLVTVLGSTHQHMYTVYVTPCETHMWKWPWRLTFMN